MNGRRRQIPVRDLKARSAFTLIELLVVTSIMAVVAGVVLSSLTAGLRVWDSARRFNAVESQAAIGLEILERDIMNAVRFHDISFAGRDSEMKFPGLVVSGEDRRIGTFKYLYDPINKAVLRKSWPYPADEPGGGTETIAVEVESLSIEYYEPPKSGDQPGRWRQSWGDATNSPSAVRVSMKFSEPGGSVTRTIVSAVDPVSMEQE